METAPFSTLGLRPELLEAINSMGFESPSAIQAMAIPPALEGVDVVGLSQTGSGKTAAFGLPALEKLHLETRQVQCLILCPTRELAVQVCEEVHRLGSKMPGLQTLAVYGGASIDRQIRSLRKGPHIVVGTPGRLLDHMRRGGLRLDSVRMCVLDEADRMLDMGFREEMDTLLEALPEKRQMLFFSATMNRGVSALTRKFGNNPHVAEVERKHKTVDTIDQHYYEVRGRSKLEVLSRLLDIDPPTLAIVFCNTKRAVDDCTEALAARGYAVDRLHGDITQQMRERVLNRFKQGKVELLVATDVAARGLDIDNVDVVFNYDLPQDSDDYIHRIGRTGRAGRSGRAVTFVFGRETYRLQSIEKFTRQKITWKKIPSQEEVVGKQVDFLFDEVKERVEGGNFGNYDEYLSRLFEQGHTPTDVASALFSLLHGSSGREGQFIPEDNEKGKREPQARPRREDRGKRDDRPRRDDRGPRERGPVKTRPTHGDVKTLFLSIGKLQGVKPGEVAGMIYRESGVPSGALGKINIMPRHTLVSVEEEHADDVLDALQKAKYRGKKFRSDVDRD